MSKRLIRRKFLQAGAFGALAVGVRASFPSPLWASTGLAVPHDTGKPLSHLVIRKEKIEINGRATTATTINGSVPGPALRFREGDTVTIRVKNDMAETTSIHWHGILLPFEMDGVPGVSFPGIRPGETFTYQYKLRQSGTYWYHSHSGMQEQTGMYGPYLIDPADGEPVKYDREFVVVLSDWTFENPMRVVDKIKKQADYYNHQKRTVPDFFRDAAQNGWRPTLSDRLMWARMRMDPTDILDVTGSTYTYLINGASPDLNWTALFKPGERIRLRFINSASMTIFDVRIPGLKMTVFQADGQNVEPVEIEEFRVGPAETCDVIVEPKDDAYCIFAESMDRSGYAAGILAPREGLRATIPPRRKRPIRTMADMGMAHSGMGPMNGHQMHDMKGMKMPSMMHGPDHHGPGNAMVAMMPKSRLSEPGTGLEDAGRRVLVYTDLRRLTPDKEHGEAQRGVEFHLTGNMERQMWGFDGKKFSEASAAIPLLLGEWFRITLVNDTMMDHPMHLHGMFMVLENGAGDRMPHKHTILVKAGEKLSFLVKPDERGPFAFHCHLLLHMELGMFRVVSVSDRAIQGTK
jgi:CopA family copper-resistance protein